MPVQISKIYAERLNSFISPLGYSVYSSLRSSRMGYIKALCGINPQKAANFLNSADIIEVGSVLFDLDAKKAAKVLDQMHYRKAGELFYYASPKMVAERVVHMDTLKAAAALDFSNNERVDSDRSNFWLQCNNLDKILLELWRLDSIKLADISINMGDRNAAKGLSLLNPRSAFTRLSSIIGLERVGKILDQMEPSAIASIILESRTNPSIGKSMLSVMTSNKSNLVLVNMFQKSESAAKNLLTSMGFSPIVVKK